MISLDSSLFTSLSLPELLFLFSSVTAATSSLSLEESGNCGLIIEQWRRWRAIGDPRVFIVGNPWNDIVRISSQYKLTAAAVIDGIGNGGVTNGWVQVVPVGLGLRGFGFWSSHRRGLGWVGLGLGVGCWVGFGRGWVVPEGMGTGSAGGDGYE